MYALFVPHIVVDTESHRLPTNMRGGSKQEPFSCDRSAALETGPKDPPKANR